MKASEFANALRAVADWYDEHPEVPAPYEAAFNVFVESKEMLATIARLAAPMSKGQSESWFWLRRDLGPARVEFNVPRQQVCERRVVGHRVVPEQHIPEHKVEIVEWDCQPILPDEVTA